VNWRRIFMQHEGEPLTAHGTISSRDTRSSEAPRIPEPSLGSALGGASLMSICTDDTRPSSGDQDKTVSLSQTCGSCRMFIPKGTAQQIEMDSRFNWAWCLDDAADVPADGSGSCSSYESADTSAVPR
jgi:hypothetical protein